VLNRPFENYSGDISGRFIEIMAMRSRAGLPVHPAFRQLLDELPRLQRPGGYFCASGVIDWQQPIDQPISLEEEDGWFSTSASVTEVEFIYDGSVYAENRCCERLSNVPRCGVLFVIGYVPKLLAAKGHSPVAVSWSSILEYLTKKSLGPLSSAMRSEDCSFVVSRLE
jgi:hypothetical protein